MAKESNLYICAKCDAQFPKWSGRCSECGAWGQVMAAGAGSTAKQAKPADLINLADINHQADQQRWLTGIEEIDRVFGGGIVKGSLSLLGGEPGIGKSTLVAQIAKALSQTTVVLYVSGEESASQIKLRLDRLNCPLHNLKFVSSTKVAAIVAAAQALQPGLIIIDSIQTMVTDDLPAEAGNVSQIRAAAVGFLELAKQHNIAVILIGHITKDGSLAGPKTLEHLVDTVIYLETDPSAAYRFLRATKNRFGSTNELGIFAMTADGLLPVANPTGIFLEDNDERAAGSVISAITEGTRPFLVEVQALVSKTIFGYPVRRASGFDLNRLQVLTAVLSKRSTINLASADVVINIVGGLKINDPGLDLAVCLAIASAFKNRPLPSKTLIVGEVGLSGEIRSVARLEDKLQEAVKLNFQRAIIPDHAKIGEIKNLTVIKVKDLAAALAQI